MPQSDPTKRRPVTLETRKNLLYNDNRRRSVPNLMTWSVMALLLGLAIGYALKGVVVIEETAAPLDNARR